MEPGSPTATNDAVRQINDLCGHPVRVTVLDSASRERMERIAGVLASAGAAGLTVDCLRPVPARLAGAPVTVEVLVHGNLSWCDSTVRNVGGVAMDKLHLDAPTHIETLQRRRHQRVDIDVPVHLFQLRSGEAVSAVLRDLSAGGASMLTSVPLPAGERVLLVFTLGSGLSFRDLEAETVRCADGPDGRYVLALRFLYDQGQEDALAAWVSQKLSGVERLVDWT